MNRSQSISATDDLPPAPSFMSLKHCHAKLQIVETTRPIIDDLC